MRECTFVHTCVSTKMRVCVPVCVRAAMHTGNDRCQHLWAVMRLRPAGAVSSLGPGGGPLSCLVARAQPSYSTCDLLCLQEGGTCFMHGGYLQAGVSRLWDQERLPGGQAAPPSPLYGHSPHLWKERGRKAGREGGKRKKKGRGPSLVGQWLTPCSQCQGAWV